MDKIEIIESIEPITGKALKFVVISHGNNCFTSMPKSTYDAIQAEQSTPMVTDEASTL